MTFEEIIVNVKPNFSLIEVMNLTPLVIASYVEETLAEKEAKRLRTSCQCFEIEAQIEPGNGCDKPTFILQKLMQNERPVLWVNVDAVFLKPASFTEFESSDFSVRLNEFLPKSHTHRIETQVVFARPTQHVVALLKTWHSLLENAAEPVDHIALRDALESTSAIEFLSMPLQFCRLYSFDDFFISQRDMVIEHRTTSNPTAPILHECCSSHCCD